MSVSQRLLGLLYGTQVQEIHAEFPMVPLDAVGMPVPGPDFIAHAERVAGSHFRVEDVLPVMYRQALYDEQMRISVRKGAAEFNVMLVPGHMLGDSTADGAGGPRQARVMIIGSRPGNEETEQARNFVGPSSRLLFDLLQQVGIREQDWRDWYATTVCHWQLPSQVSSIPEAWLRDNKILLEQELRMVQPDYILSLGADSNKALFGKNAPKGNTTGLEFPLEIKLPDGGTKTARVFPVMNPGRVLHEGALTELYIAQLQFFSDAINNVVRTGEADVVHKNVYYLEELRELVDQVISDPSRHILSMDAEWHGVDPVEPDAYLRTIQFATKEKEAYCVVLRYQGGGSAFKPNIASAMKELQRLVTPDPSRNYHPRLGGHAFRADSRQLVMRGIDVRPAYKCAESPEKMRTEGGWDTIVAIHAMNEATLYGLEEHSVRLTTAPRYDEQVDAYLSYYCKTAKVGRKRIHGFGMVPEWVLHGDRCNYAAYDPDVSLRIMKKLHIGDDTNKPMLDADVNGNPCWEPYFNTHRASLAILEVEMEGLDIDMKQLLKLSRRYQETYNALLKDFREKTNWPDFTPSKGSHRLAFLYGDKYVKDKNGNITACRPQGAVTLGMMPLKATDKKCRRSWQELEIAKVADQYSPAADRETLGILSHQHPLAGQLRDLRFIGHVLSTLLRPPTNLADLGDIVDDEGSEDIDPEFDRGLGDFIRSDGKVHSRLSTNKQTGRMGSADPNCQNFSKRREDDYKQIQGVWSKGVYKGRYQSIFPEPMYMAPLRSVVTAPSGYLIIESDYKVAEVAGLGWLANDKTMMHEVMLSCLPEDHPDYLDLHAVMAVEAFKLTCEPSKKALADLGKSGLRVAAKNVRFGVPYGRQAKAIMMQCREENADVSLEGAQELIDFYHEKYANASAFLTECRERVSSPGWIATTFGRYRRFPQTNDETQLRAMEREAQNFPIQALVADALYQAMHNMYEDRKTNGLHYRLKMPIHDALLTLVPIEEVNHFVHFVVPKCMSRGVPIYPRTLAGVPIPGAGPYYFDTSAECYTSWGDHLTDEELAELGIDLHNPPA